MDECGRLVDGSFRLGAPGVKFIVAKLRFNLVIKIYPWQHPFFAAIGLFATATRDEDSDEDRSLIQ